MKLNLQTLEPRFKYQEKHKISIFKACRFARRIAQQWVAFKYSFQSETRTRRITELSFAITLNPAGAVERS